MSPMLKGLAYRAGLDTRHDGIVLTRQVDAAEALNNFGESIVMDIIHQIDDYDFKIDPDELIIKLEQRYFQRSK